MRSHLLGILAAAAAFGLSPLQAHAGTFSISPLRVELSSASQTGVLTIRNQEATPVVVQAEHAAMGTGGRRGASITDPRRAG
jgi:P pilus assembly chaperone PapD